MYKQAVRRNRQYVDQGKVKLFLGDFVEAKKETDKYHKIFLHQRCLLLNDLKKPLEKTISLIKPDGTFCFFMAHPDFIRKLNPADNIFNKYSIEQMVDALNTATFKKIKHYLNKGY